MDTDDVLHILVKDLVGIIPTIELYDNEGNVEDDYDFPYGPVYTGIYGALYNWYAVVDPKNIANTGWHVPTNDEWTTLTDYLIANNYGYGGSGNDIGKAVSSTSGWTSSAVAGNVGNDQSSNNSSGLNIQPGGFRRNTNGDFMNRFDYVYLWTSTQHPTVPMSALSIGILYNFSVVFATYYAKKGGEYVYLVKDDAVSNGFYVGNDGRVYAAGTFGTQVWMKQPLAETKFRDGTNIPLVADSASWIALATAGMCWYNNIEI